MYRPISDYAVIGNLRSAVLVSKGASIDWAPAPFINSPSVFAAILDDEKGGTWQISPAHEVVSSEQYYEDKTNVLVTHFRTHEGEMTVTDFIPIEREKAFLPAEEDTTFRIHRKVSCTRGRVRARTIFQPRFDYARGETVVKHVDGGVRAESNGKHGVLTVPRGTVEISDNTAVVDAELSEGDSEFFIFRYNIGSIALREDEFEHHEHELAATRDYWRDWVHRCELTACPVAGKWHAEAIRSSLLLKILFFEPVGTIAAAPTTSLPEHIGGVRNWDYRFTWIRDASMTLTALFNLGYVREAREFVEWIISICREQVKDDPSHLQTIYGLAGEHDLPEETLDHFSGYRGSSPVRIGNRAYEQRQLDIYGSVLDMVWTIHLLREGQDHRILNDETWEILRGFANYAARVWREPDEGLWEVRTGRRHFVYSKVMCWVALDRAIKIADAHGLEGEREYWNTEKQAIHETVMDKGWDNERGCFVQHFDSDALDASVLTFSALGFLDGEDPRMRSTIAGIERELGAGDGLVYRYNTDDGLPGEEGAFLLASFWLVDALVLAGESERARDIYERVVGRINHVGLLSEEIEPQTGVFLGNFPQAYTHIGLINSAFRLAAA